MHSKPLALFKYFVRSLSTLLLSVCNLQHTYINAIHCQSHHCVLNDKLNNCLITDLLLKIRVCKFICNKIQPCCRCSCTSYIIEEPLKDRHTDTQQKTNICTNYAKNGETEKAKKRQTRSWKKMEANSGST